jgi:glycine/D-amino acid oxidase-like deaminating enzyme/dihydrodipicolinate reductase
MKRFIHTNSSSQRFRLTIIGAGGAIGLPASYLASLRNVRLVMIDNGSAAINNSTHTVHTSIVRPNNAVWPFSKAIESWLNNGPFDMRLSLGMVPFGLHSMLQSYCVSENRILEMWKAFRTLGLESREIYLNFDKKFGPITLDGTGRGHLSTPLVADDNEIVLSLREKLSKFGVKSEILTSSKDIQNYVGRLPIRHPGLMVHYPEDFVPDLHQYKTQLLNIISENGGTCLQDTVIGIERDSRGNVTTVITEQGQRIQTDAVFYAGGWKANTFLKDWLGVNLNYHLSVASGVRFALPGHLVNHAIVCGAMFLAPGHDDFGNEITDVAQMFLVNITDPYPSEKHRTQAIKRFHTYFNYQGDIPKIWNCIGRPITTTGLPFIERVAPNMVVALGPGMFGVTTGAGLAQRGLDLLLDNKIHLDHAFFERQSGWKIISSFFQENLTPTKASVKHCFRPSSKSPRVIQLGKRGAMTGVLHQILAQSHDFTVYGAREISAVIRDIQTHPETILLVASHGMQAKLPAHYGKDYVSANQAIEKVLAQAQCQNLSGIIVISGGIPKTILQELILLASNRRVRFVHLPCLGTSMEVLLNAIQSLLPNIENPIKITIEDTFHKGKKESPSAGGSQLLDDVAKRFGTDRLLILVSDFSLQTELTSQYPDATIKVAHTDNEIQRISHQFPGLITVVSRSYRLDAPYHYQHRFTVQENTFTITFEQSVASRAPLVRPVHQVIQKLATLPPGFSGIGISSVLPVIAFKPRSSFTESLRSIIMSLQNADAILSVQTRQAEPDQWIQKLLTDSSGQMIRFQHAPSLSCCMQINAGIDAQPFLISLSTTSAQAPFPNPK